MTIATAAESLRTPKFLYFDLGNVLLFFDHRKAAAQMAAHFACPAERMWDLVFAGGMNDRLDAGTFTTRGMYDALCDEVGCSPDYDAVCTAGADIFEMNFSMSAVVTHLKNAGYRTGILSNTSDLHWQFISRGRYAFLQTMFDVVVLSYEHQAMKPKPEIYHLAAKMAGVTPEEIFYVDDLLKNVDGARAAGFDAVQYTTTAAYVDELRRRGIRTNY
jgi:FMN phosphatase YigB (HAD superfamily)